MAPFFIIEREGAPEAHLSGSSGPRSASQPMCSLGHAPHLPHPCCGLTWDVFYFACPSPRAVKMRQVLPFLFHRVIYHASCWKASERGVAPPPPSPPLPDTRETLSTSPLWAVGPQTVAKSPNAQRVPLLEPNVYGVGLGTCSEQCHLSGSHLIRVCAQTTRGTILNFNKRPSIFHLSAASLC